MTVNRNRLPTWEERETLDIDGVTLEEVSEIILRLINKYGSDAIIERGEERYGEGHYYAVMQQRPETDEEMASRIRQQENLEYYQRLQYELLKRKFEGEGK